MHEDKSSGSDDDDGYTDADRYRISELFPRDLTALFVPSPQKTARDVPHHQPLVVAGTESRCDVSLERMQVVMRIRPPLQHGVPSWSKENCIHAVSGSTVAIAPPENSQGYKNGDRGQTYNFTRVFNEHTGQEEYFQSTAAPLVRHLVQEHQAAAVLMAYGISAAGKTYTIEGTRSEPGVLPRALDLLFQEVKASPDELSVKVSQFEVYNEQIFDLLAEEAGAVLGHRPALRLKEDSQGRIFVRDLSEAAVGSAAQAMEMQRRGARQRQKAATALNYHSSRSHSVFTVALYTDATGAANSDEAQRVGRLSFVDLAGSERANRTGNVGVRLKESVAINASLMTLGRCLEALRWNQQHRAAEPKLVPYRESKVTHLFRDVLHGWGQIMLSVNVSPCAKDYDETSHVLKYASLATQIGTAARAEAPVRALKAISPNITKKRAPKPDPVPSNLGPPNKQKKGGVPEAKPQGLLEDTELTEALSSGGDGGLPGGYASSSDEEDTQDCEGMQGLQEEVRRLHDQLVAAEERCALAETEIRQEVSAEMASLLHDMEANYKERLASEVAAVENRKHVGKSKPAKGGTACMTTTQSTQTDTDTLPAEMPSTLQQLKAELREVQAELRSKDESLAAALILRTELLTAAHDSVLKHALDAELVQAQTIRWSEQLGQAQSGAAAERQLRTQLGQEIEGVRLELTQLQAQHSELQSQHACLKTKAESLQALEATHKADLQCMTQRAEAAQDHASLSKASTLAIAQQFDQLQARSSLLEQTQEDLKALILEAAQHVRGGAELVKITNVDGSILSAATALIECMQLQTEEAEAAAVTLTKQLQEAEGAHALQVEQLREALQRAHLHSQAAKPEAAASLRHSMEKEMQQQVTQLEANSQMEVEMLEQQLCTSRKEVTSLKRRLEAATAALASASIVSANPALLRVMRAEGKEGPYRGAGGTPHALALAWAREEAARLSPAVAMASSSKTPYPALGLSTLAPSPHQYRTHSCNMSPHPSATDAPAGSVDQPQHESSQQHTLPSAAASGLAAGAHQLEAQWEADSLTAAQTASRLSLLQAEHTQVELELATAAQHADAKAGDAGLSHDQRQEAVVATAAAAAEAACDNPHESFPFVPVQQHQHATVSSNKTQSQRAETASQATQSQSVKPTQSNRTGSRRMTRSSARASLASQNSESHAVSTAQGGRRCQTQAGLSLPVVMERSEADLAADSAVSTAEMDDDHQTLVSHAAAEAAADRDAEPSGNQHLLAIDTALASVPEEADGSAPPASPTLPQGDTQQIMVLGRDDLHDCDAHLASASGYAAAEAAASAPSQEAARQTRHIQSAQHSGRVDGCDAVQASASDNATVSAANGVEANEQISGRPDSAAEGSSPAAQSKQGQKGKDRAKQPPKCRQAVRKRQNRKQGRTASARDENADVNTVSTSQHLSVHSSDTSAAKQHTSGGAALDYSASSPVQKGCQEIGASDQMGLADKVEGSSKPPRNEQPKRRKLQPATPMSRTVQEALGEFVTDDSIFRQHMKQTPVALRTRRATRFGGL